jgi:predicted ArsR family transcriptional regulator
MTDPRFDALVHEPTRLQLCGLLVTVKEVEFQTLRDALDIADSVTSKHLKALEDAGYVEMHKRRPAVGRPRTWVAITERGRAAFAGHLAELHRLATLSATADPPEEPSGP